MILQIRCEFLYILHCTALHWPIQFLSPLNQQGFLKLFADKKAQVRCSLKTWANLRIKRPNWSQIYHTVVGTVTSEVGGGPSGPTRNWKWNATSSCFPPSHSLHFHVRVSVSESRPSNHLVGFRSPAFSTGSLLFHRPRGCTSRSYASRGLSLTPPVRWSPASTLSSMP